MNSIKRAFEKCSQFISDNRKCSGFDSDSIEMSEYFHQEVYNEETDRSSRHEFRRIHLKSECTANSSQIRNLSSDRGFPVVENDDGSICGWGDQNRLSIRSESPYRNSSRGRLDHGSRRNCDISHEFEDLRCRSASRSRYSDGRPVSRNGRLVPLMCSDSQEFGGSPRHDSRSRFERFEREIDVRSRSASRNGEYVDIPFGLNTECNSGYSLSNLDRRHPSRSPRRRFHNGFADCERLPQYADEFNGRHLRENSQDDLCFGATRAALLPNCGESFIRPVRSDDFPPNGYRPAPTAIRAFPPSIYNGYDSTHSMSNINYATVIDNPDFRADVYAEKIDRALRAGEKETVVDLITSISNAQRQQLRAPYKLKYGKDIDVALDKKFSGDLETAILSLMYTPLEYDLKQLKYSMKGLGTDEQTLVEILCSRTPDQLRAIRAGYEREYGTQLEKDVKGDTSGEFRDLLVALVTGSKDGSHETNDSQAKDDAVRLFADGKGKFAGDKNAPSHFLKILATQNQYQLRKVFAEFEALSGGSIEKAIEKEFSGDLRNSYLTIARASTNKQKFFAHQLYASMKGFGTRDNDLIRVLVTRSEVDLNIIKEEFQVLYGKNLDEMIKGDTSGLYRECLLKLVKGNYIPH